MRGDLLSVMQGFDWPAVIGFGNNLEELDSAQWRFLKGLAVELAVEQHSHGEWQYVGQEHRDFEWRNHALSVELKSQFSLSMYDRTGALRRNFGLQFNNSYGTNNRAQLPPAEVADVLVVVRNDGALAVERDTVIAHSHQRGDGFVVKLPRDCVHVLAGPVAQKQHQMWGIREAVIGVLRGVIAQDR